MWKLSAAFLLHDFYRWGFEAWTHWWLKQSPTWAPQQQQQHQQEIHDQVDRLSLSDPLVSSPLTITCFIFYFISREKSQVIRLFSEVMPTCNPQTKGQSHRFEDIRHQLTTSHYFEPTEAHSDAFGPAWMCFYLKIIYPYTDPTWTPGASVHSTGYFSQWKSGMSLYFALEKIS